MKNVERRKLLGEAVKQRRISSGLSMRKFAAMANTSHKQLWQIETGQVNVGFDMICEIADALGICVHDLIDF